jgi:hypothetical protein
VKAKAEDAVLLGNRRIAEELKKVPKTAGGNRESKFPYRENLKSGKATTGIKPTSRHRLSKLAEVSTDEFKALENTVLAKPRSVSLRRFQILLLLALTLALAGCDHADRLHPNPPQCDAAGKDCR